MLFSKQKYEDAFACAPFQVPHRKLFDGNPGYAWIYIFVATDQSTQRIVSVCGEKLNSQITDVISLSYKTKGYCIQLAKAQVEQIGRNASPPPFCLLVRIPSSKLCDVM